MLLTEALFSSPLVFATTIVHLFKTFCLFGYLTLNYLLYLLSILLVFGMRFNKIYKHFVAKVFIEVISISSTSINFMKRQTFLHKLCMLVIKTATLWRIYTNYTHTHTRTNKSWVKCLNNFCGLWCLLQVLQGHLKNPK